MIFLYQLDFKNFMKIYILNKIIIFIFCISFFLKFFLDGEI
jgi:hypothetical protein